MCKCECKCNGVVEMAASIFCGMATGTAIFIVTVLVRDLINYCYS